MKLAFDTTIFVRAMRDSHFNRALQRCWRECGPFIYVHRTVMAELLLGAGDETTRARWLDRWQRPAQAVGRPVTPQPGAWDDVSRVILALGEGGALTTLSRGFFNDCVIALSCSRAGIELVTENTADAERIAGVAPGFRFRRTLPPG